MHEEEFRLVEKIEEHHWWFEGRRLILRSLLARHAPTGNLLDLGCGTGGLLRALADHRGCVGIDRSGFALQVCRQKGLEVLVRGDLEELPFAPDSFDNIVALDVIEHLDDDVAFLANASQLCTSGGSFIIAVPAFQLLWSQHDETFEHRRRYSAVQLESVVRKAGLIPERTTYTNFLIFPMAAVWRVLSYRLGLGRIAPRHDFWRMPRNLNWLLARFYRLEAWLLDRVDLPFGVSVVCVARKG